MKSILIFIGIFLSFGFTTKPVSNIVFDEIINTSNKINCDSLNDNEKLLQTRVYICGGYYAEKFHSRSNCRGLNNCNSEIYYYNSEQEAINEGYKYCLICWK